ncbi:MAG: DNA translocase FtsK [Clostridiales bacterium]|nr:DNA translocase FtsK [Clostridiales bacterium]
MSTAAKKKGAAAHGLHTSMRAAHIRLLGGVVLLVVGVLFLLSQLWRGNSTVLWDISAALQGLSGSLCLLLPVWMIYAAVKTLVGLWHRVPMRDVWITLGLLIVILAFQTLITMITGRGSLMEYIGYINEQRVMENPASYGAYLKRAYGLGSQLGGGLLGMLLAYPIWGLLGQWPSAVLLVVGAVALFIWLLGINLKETIEQMSSRQEERQARRAAEERERMAQQEAEQRERVQELPMSELNPGQQVQYVQDEGQQGYVRDRYASADAMYYDQLQRRSAVQQPMQKAPSGVGGTFYEVSSDRIYDEHFDTQQVYHEPVVTETAEEEPNGQEKPVVQAPPAQNAPQEELPWYDEVVPVEEMVDEPVLKDVTAPAHHAEEKPAPQMQSYAEKLRKAEAAPAEAEKKEEPRQESKPSTASSWLDQLNKRRRQAEMTPADGQLIEQVTSGHAKPVFTENAVELTGERIPIRSVPSRHELPGESKNEPIRMDGTATQSRSRTIGAPLMINYKAPPLHFLSESADQGKEDHSREDNERAQVIEETLRSFNVAAEVKQVMHGPAITRFAIQIAPGIRVSRVLSMADNLALSLKTKHVRMEAPIQGTNYIGIEVPNARVTPVMIRDVLLSDAMQVKKTPLAVALGKDIAGTSVICDLDDMPHLLIAGSTGSGKSVCIQSIVSSILYRASPDDVRMIMIDPKQVELKMYDGIPHLLIPVVTDMRKAAGALSWAVQEMEERYTKISDIGERNLKGYNSRQKPEDRLPSIVIIIDELADLMDTCRKDVEESIRRLAAKARAAGIYMVLATQRPSVDVITGVIKNNIPSRIAFAVSSGTDSRTILDGQGAEKLVGKGDMLYKPSGAPPLRVQGSFITAEECRNIADYIRKHYQANYDPNILEHLENDGQEDKAVAGREDEGDMDDGQVDELLHEVIQMAIEEGQTSTSMLQRRLRIGYARAGRLVDEMERRGIVSPQDGSKARKTLITREQYYEMFEDE